MALHRWLEHGFVQAFDGRLPSIVNLADSNSPTVAEIGHTIMDIVDIKNEHVSLLEDTPVHLL
ncbi:MAG: hypothetical protein AB8B64_17710 [Granulosicoccus sp.]